MEGSTATQAELVLTRPARSESLAEIRRAVGAAASSAGADAATLTRIRLAVNEACSNVIRHAYGDEEGDLAVELTARGAAIDVRVWDDGRGFGVHSEDPGAGLGLALIRTVSDGLEIRDGLGGRGTDVRMRFRLARAA